MDTKELYNKIIDGDAYEAEKNFNNLAMLKAQDRIDDTFDEVVNELNGGKINEEEDDSTYYASLDVDNTEKLYKMARASKNWKDFQKEMLKNKNLFPDKKQINFNKVDWEAVYKRTMDESVINEAKKKYTVRLADDTVGEYECMNDKFIGKKITVKLHDENGNPIEKTGKAEEILDIDESVINEKDLEPEVIDYVTAILKNSKKKLNFDEIADMVIAKYGRNAITWRNAIKMGFHNNRQKFN